MIFCIIYNTITTITTIIKKNIASKQRNHSASLSIRRLVKIFARILKTPCGKRDSEFSFVIQKCGEDSPPKTDKIHTQNHGRSPQAAARCCSHCPRCKRNATVNGTIGLNVGTLLGLFLIIFSACGVLPGSV